jgi:hypothetical protein
MDAYNAGGSRMTGSLFFVTHKRIRDETRDNIFPIQLLEYTEEYQHPVKIDNTRYNNSMIQQM